MLYFWMFLHSSLDLMPLFCYTFVVSIGISVPAVKFQYLFFSLVFLHFLFLGVSPYSVLFGGFYYV